MDLLWACSSISVYIASIILKWCSIISFFFFFTLQHPKFAIFSLKQFYFHYLSFFSGFFFYFLETLLYFLETMLHHSTHSKFEESYLQNFFQSFSMTKLLFELQIDSNVLEICWFFLIFYFFLDQLESIKASNIATLPEHFHPSIYK